MDGLRDVGFCLKGIVMCGSNCVLVSLHRTYMDRLGGKYMFTECMLYGELLHRHSGPALPSR